MIDPRLIDWRLGSSSVTIASTIYAPPEEEKETEMADWKILRDECEKMAERYGLKLEVDYEPIKDLFMVRFMNRKTSLNRFIYNVCMNDPRVVLEDIERTIIERFDINLNDYEPVKVPRIKDVIHNDPATIVFWEDGTKTVVKCQDGDVYDPEKGLAMAISKKALGNKGNYCEVFKKWLPEEETFDETTRKAKSILGMTDEEFDKFIDTINFCNHAVTGE